MLQGTVALKKILVVDDESLIRYSLTMILQNDAIEVRAAATGAEALIEVHSHFYDVCFLDIHLPDMSGIEILKEIREISPETIILIISADEPEKEGLMDQRKDREYYIPKPFDLFQVKAFVDKILREGSPRYHEEHHAIKDYTAFVNRLVSDQRIHERKPIDKRITCMGTSARTEDEASVFDANVIDISDGGIGIAMDFELRPGQTLRFFDRVVACLGIVRWIRKIDDTPWYRSGIQFTEQQRLPREESPRKRN